MKINVKIKLLAGPRAGETETVAVDVPVYGGDAPCEDTLPDADDALERVEHALEGAFGRPTHGRHAGTEPGAGWDFEAVGLAETMDAAYRAM